MRPGRLPEGNRFDLGPKYKIFTLLAAQLVGAVYVHLAGLLNIEFL